MLKEKDWNRRRLDFHHSHNIKKKKGANKMKLYSVFTLEKREIAAVTLNKKDKTAKNENAGQNTI